MRFTVTIETPPADSVGPAAIWKVEIMGAGKTWRRDMVQKADGAGGFLPFPSPATLAEDPPAATSQLPEYVLKLYNDIVARNAERITDYGRYLFDNLLGKVIWGEIVEEAKSQHERIIELALSWALTDANLSRLHWEMMFDGVNFLAAGHLLDGKRIIDVAITRVVRKTAAVPGPLSAFPRVLFVIGTSLSDPTIRPGAEIMGLIPNRKPVLALVA